ncbi:MAG: hypothetical protein DDT19_02835 [Syntrophomonadaceae bacterium]|nr:hypothetical protein [Bacillota bacterium]
MIVKINTNKILLENDLVFIKLNNSFIQNLRKSLIRKYKSLRNYNEKILKINYTTLKYGFLYAKYHNFQRFYKITQDLDIDKDDFFQNIEAFKSWGSRRKELLYLPIEIEIDEFFVEGYALYLAEGDTGFNGKTIPSKLRFTNSNLGVIKYFINWINRYFPNNYFYLNIIIPNGIDVKEDFVDVVKVYTGLDKRQIKITKDFYNKQIKYRVCFDRAIVINLILKIEESIKKAARADEKLARAYIRGMMIGEGTAYFNKSRYVRIEMRNEKEIKYLYNLFQVLGYDCKPSLRSERINMWSIYIGAKQLEKFYNEIGFGIHQPRQEILEKAVNKKLRINQYV